MTTEPKKLLAEWCMKEHRPCVLYMDRMTVFQIASLLQLAMRHPHLPEHVREHAELIVLTLQGFMPEDIRALSLQGDDRRLDVPPMTYL